MDVKQGYSRDRCLHICHVDTDELENGTASIVGIIHRLRDEERDAMIDSRGFFICIDDGNPFHRDHWRMK